MAAKLLRTVISWLAAPLQPSVLPLTMVLGVLFVIVAVDFVAIMMSGTFQQEIQIISQLLKSISL